MARSKNVTRSKNVNMNVTGKNQKERMLRLIMMIKKIKTGDLSVNLCFTLIVYIDSYNVDKLLQLIYISYNE